MALILSLALAQVATTATPPANWAALPLAHLNQPPGLTYGDTVPVMQMAERRIGCRVGIGPMPGPDAEPTVRMRGLILDLVMLVAPDGRLLDVVAAQGPCDAIRNYARDLITRRYRGKVRPPAGPDPAWYRVGIRFRWE